jgi:hypothetical protein
MGPQSRKNPKEVQVQVILFSPYLKALARLSYPQIFVN